jgi:hypothetical protein
MPRRTWVQDPDTGELVPKEEYIPKRHLNAHNLIMGDRHYDGLRATDGTDISTRAKHRAYMKANNLTTTDDFQSTWTREAQRRAEYYKEGKHGAIRREDVGRAIHDLESGRVRPNSDRR